MKTLLCKWLGISKLTVRLDYHANEIVKRITETEVDEMLAKHFEELREYLKPTPITVVEEKKQPMIRARRWSEFRAKIEPSSEG